MNDWMYEAARLARKRAPQITPMRALELADDLYKAWHEEWTPAKAVGWFFAFMPLGWPVSETERLSDSTPYPGQLSITS